ncbi:MAG TPA: right-handed parallel beta-helix repeat-containing protein [Candidatus Krumholzibacteria bacterium]|nr:right-handed parallel beta-helix repeat-containing protein [Candidatus Krumholzibacteria bacterium]
MKTAIATLAVVLLSAASSATTWHVAQDGSGDFSVIQDAVDAASPGDTIWIHAGRYTERTSNYDVWGDGSNYAEVHVAITVDDLTLIGDGRDATIIGPTEYPSPPYDQYYGICVAASNISSFAVRDLAVETAYNGILAGRGSVDIQRCRFERTPIDGVTIYTASGCTIVDCSFVDLVGTGVTSWWPSEDIVISNCEFDDCDANYFVTSQNVLVEECVFTGGVVSLNFQQGTSGEVTGCEISGYENYGFAAQASAVVSVTSTNIVGGVGGVYVSGSSVVIDDSTISGQWGGNLEIAGGGTLEVHNSNIINGGGWSVLCRNAGTSDCHLDMTNNYWGTDLQQQIEEWISDSNDVPDRCCEVDFIPFSGIVPVESHTWTEVKQIFRPSGR